MNSHQQIAPSVKALRIVYFGMVIGMVSFAAIIFYVTDMSPEMSPFATMQKEFLVAVLFIAATCLGIAGYLWKRRLSKIRELGSIAEKLQAYQAASITRYAMTEAPGLLATIGFFLTANQRFLVVVLIVLVAVSLFYPSDFRVARDIREDESAVQDL